MSASDKPPSITSALAPDLDAVKKFIADMIASGSIAALVAAMVALLARMRDLNAELMKKLSSKSRRHPPSETMRRLQMELPFLCTAAANDVEPQRPKGKEPKKRGAKHPKAHGRPQLPAHLPRVPHVTPVPADKRTHSPRSSPVRRASPPCCPRPTPLRAPRTWLPPRRRARRPT